MVAVLLLLECLIVIATVVGKSWRLPVMLGIISVPLTAMVVIGVSRVCLRSFVKPVASLGHIDIDQPAPPVVPHRILKRLFEALLHELGLFNRACGLGLELLHLIPVSLFNECLDRVQLARSARRNPHVGHLLQSRTHH